MNVKPYPQLMEYEYRSLKGDVLANESSPTEAKQLAILRMQSKGIGEARLYTRGNSDEPWSESPDLLENPRFDADFPRS